MKFFLLKDSEYYGEIIKKEEDNFYRFVFGTNEWLKTNLFYKYLDEKSNEYFNKYEEIDDKKIVKILSEQINFYQILWNLAFDLAMKEHSEGIDKIGEPKIVHCKAISDKFEIFDFKIVAILHDIIRDTNIEIDDLYKLNFPKKIINAINVITIKKDEEYIDYIKRIKKNEIARLVKIEDLKYHLNPSKISKFKNMEEMKEKYSKALKILES